MLFRTEDIETDLELSLATHLRAHGYDVLWHESGETESQTAGLGTAKGTVTLVDEFPANPEFIVGLRGDSGSAQEIVVPAFSLQLPDQPTRVQIMGLGHKDYVWQRNVRIDGLVTDKFQQRQFGDLLHEFFNEREAKEFTIQNYDTNPVTALGVVWVEVAGVHREVLYTTPDVTRYYVMASANIRYIE